MKSFELLIFDFQLTPFLALLVYLLDAKPYMGAIPGYEGAYINAGHNCWGKLKIHIRLVGAITDHDFSCAQLITKALHGHQLVARQWQSLSWMESANL
jgi:hypothetical protein